MAEDVFFFDSVFTLWRAEMSVPDVGGHDALRHTLRQARRAIPAQQRIAAAKALADFLLSLPFAPSAGHVAGYWAVDGEIALHAWQLRLPPKVRYCLPVLHVDGRLRFAPFSPGVALKHNRFGIPEPDVAETELHPPEAMALVVLPLLGFDRSGNRLGMGGGWYDRSFAFRQRQPPPPYLVGAGFAMQQVQAGLCAQSWDVRLDAVCCEAQCWQIPP